MRSMVEGAGDEARAFGLSRSHAVAPGVAPSTLLRPSGSGRSPSPIRFAMGEERPPHSAGARRTSWPLSSSVMT
jgi:hypothetical protein